MHKSNHTNKLIIWQQYTTILLNQNSYIYNSQNMFTH
jgi:hypothetical protein